MATEQAAVDKLIADLVSRDEPTRKKALFQMGKLLDLRAIESIKRAASEDPSAEVKYLARKLLALYEARKPECRSMIRPPVPASGGKVEEALEGLASEDTNRRGAALKACTQLADQRALAAVRARCGLDASGAPREKVAEVRSLIPAALAHLGGKSQVPILVSLMDDKDPRVRANALAAVQSIADHGCWANIVRCFQDADHRVRTAAIGALAKLGKVNLIRCCQAMIHGAGRKYWEKDSAVFLLANSTLPDAVPLLESVLTDTTPGLAQKAMKGLEKLAAKGCETATQALETARLLGIGEAAPEDFLQLETREPEAGGLILDQTARATKLESALYGNEDAVLVLVDQIRAEDRPSALARMIRALGKIGSRRAAPVLTELLTHADADVREACAETLEALGASTGPAPGLSTTPLPTTTSAADELLSEDAPPLSYPDFYFEVSKDGLSPGALLRDWRTRVLGNGPWPYGFGDECVLSPSPIGEALRRAESSGCTEADAPSYRLRSAMQARRDEILKLGDAHASLSEMIALRVLIGMIDCCREILVHARARQALAAPFVEPAMVSGTALANTLRMLKSIVQRGSPRELHQRFIGPQEFATRKQDGGVLVAFVGHQLVQLLSLLDSLEPAAQESFETYVLIAVNDLTMHAQLLSEGLAGTVALSETLSAARKRAREKLHLSTNSISPEHAKDKPSGKVPVGVPPEQSQVTPLFERGCRLLMSEDAADKRSGIQELERVVELDPNHLETRLILVGAYHRMGSQEFVDEVMRHAEVAYGIDRANAQAVNYLAVAHFERAQRAALKEQWREGYADARRAYDLEPTQPAFDLMSMLSGPASERADFIKLCEKIVSAAPDDHAKRLSLGVAYLGEAADPVLMGDPRAKALRDVYLRRAKSAFDDYVSRFPKAAGGHIALVKYYLAVEDKAFAKHHFAIVAEMKCPEAEQFMKSAASAGHPVS